MNIRNTIQRSLILEAVKELRCHATADEVYNVIVKNIPISAEERYTAI